MHTFLPTDDGYQVLTEENSIIAHVLTKKVGQTNDPNLRVQKQTETVLPREEWKIHFTGSRFAPAAVAAFLEELSQQKG